MKGLFDNAMNVCEQLKIFVAVLVLVGGAYSAELAEIDTSGAVDLRDSARVLVEGLVTVPSAKFRQALEDLPSEEAVRAIAKQINENGGFDIPGSRVTAYDVLLFHHAAEYPEGFEALIAGVDDPYVMKRAVRALQKTPAERADRAGRILAGKLEELVNRDNQDVNAIGVVLHTLSLLGPDAGVAAPSVKAVFKDTGNAYVTRLRAAAALASVATPSALVRATDQSDSLSVMTALSGLARYPYHILPFPEEPPDSMQKVAEFIYSGYRSPILSVRDVALHYGPPYFVIWYKTNPDEAGPYYDRLIATIESLATPGADAEVRASIDRSLKVLRDEKQFRDSRRKK